MTPSFRRMPDGTIRPVYLYCVDASEFVVNKLIDRGSLSATTMVANVQDFITRVAGGLGVLDESTPCSNSTANAGRLAGKGSYL